MRKMKSVRERFETKCVPEPNTGCLLWFGATTPDGYGQMRIDDANVLATHVALRLAGRPLMAGQQACHRCDNPACVEAAHLFGGSNADNAADRNRKGRQARGEAVHKTRLTEDAVRRIRSDRRTQREIAADYGISGRVVSDIQTGRTWGHVIGVPTARRQVRANTRQVVTPGSYAQRQSEQIMGLAVTLPHSR